MNRGSILGMVKHDQASIPHVGSRFFSLWYDGRGVKLTTPSPFGIEVKNDAQCAVGQCYLPERVQNGSPAHTAYPRLGTLSWGESCLGRKAAASSHC
jgi:hypothetical protein